MVYKILIVVYVLLNFATLAAAAEEPPLQLYQTITQTEAQDLNIMIPASTTSGFKSLEVEVTGMGQKPQLRKILFCKDFKGIIHWDNLCPDLTRVAAQTVLETAKSRSGFPTYDPLSNPHRTTDTVIIAFAALNLITGARAMTTKILGNEAVPTTSVENGPGYLAQLSRGEVLVAGSQLGRVDKAEIWQSPTTQKMEGFFTKVGKKISGFSPLGTRILSDGNYLRSLFGPFSLLVYPISIAIGCYSTRVFHQQALPPSLNFILLMMTIGVLDAFAGILISIAFTLSILFAGHLNSINSILTVMGVCMLAFTPVLVAGAFRPFRREVWDFTSLWERITDYLLASILTGWVVEQIVLGLPGLSGLQLPLTVHAPEIAFWATGLVILRFAAEDISIRLFPQRLIKLEPEYRARTIMQQFLATVFKVAIFAVIAGKFVGFSVELVIGVGLFALPLLMGIFADKFPKSAGVQKWMPTGIIEMLVMTLTGYILAILVQQRYPSARTYVLLSFVLLSVPGLILKILALFGKEGAKDWKVTKVGTTLYRVLGIVVLGVLIYIILSGILVSNNV